MNKTTIPQEALFSIFDGEALLFLGAGFSMGAICTIDGEGKNIEGGQGLANIIMNKLQPGLESKYGLDKASEFYENTYSRSKLLEFIAPYLAVTSAQNFHKEILSQPWNRIYTTNYDNLITKAGNLPKKLRCVGLSESIPHYTNSTIECLCVNGYMGPVPSESEIVITTHDYAGPKNERREDMIDLFRSDVSLSKSVFFLGYSLYDIDLARILQEDTTIKSKIYLITGKNTSDFEESLFAKFGTVIKIDCSEFPQLLSSAFIEYEKIPKVEEQVYSSLSRFNIQKENKSHELVYDLIVHSKLNRFELSNSMLKNESNYAVIYEKLDLITESIKNDKKLTIIHAEMCNGKTIFLEELAIRLNEFFPVFISNQANSKLNRDLLQLSKASRDFSVVIIDGYATAFNEFFPIISRLDNIILVLAERTAIHNQFRQKWSGISNDSVYSINQLTDSDIENFINIAKDNGLIGLQETVLSKRMSVDYERSIGKTILKLFEESAICDRVIREFCNVFVTEKNFKEEAYGTIILSIIIGKYFQKNVLNKLLKKNTAYTSVFSNSRLFFEILRSTDDDIFCPTTIAQFIAKKAFEPEYALQVAIQIAKRSRQKQTSDQTISRISSEIMRFNILEKILPQKNFLDNTIRFYSELKSVGSLGTMPLFWLQYAIAYINKKEYRIAQRFLHTALKLAKDTGFNTFQIDNQYAKLLLSADEHGIQEALFDRFIQAEDIIRRQVSNSNDKYIYHAAKPLASFRQYFSKFSPEELDRIVRFIDFLNIQYNKLPEDIRNDARYDMQRINEVKASAISSKTIPS